MVQFYRAANGRCRIKEVLDDLDDRILALILAVVQLVETHHMVPAQHFKTLRGRDLWKRRVGLGGPICRFLGSWDTGALIILTHGFRKKAQKTPLQGINKALNLKADWKKRK